MISKALRVVSEMREFIPRRLQQESAKVLAFKLGNIPERTVQGWQSGRYLPNAPHWIALCDLIPEFRDKTLEWLALQIGVDPDDEARLFHELQLFLMRRKAGAAGNGK